VEFRRRQRLVLVAPGGGLPVACVLPVIIGAARKAGHLAVTVMLSMFPHAWPAALAGALTLPRRQPAAPYPAP
jgi:hypothetical protein